jgi:putative N6-adenine-specific DNA methylase
MKEKEFVATTLFGLEELLAKELTELGAADVTVRNRAVEFNGSQSILYKINLGSRTAMRVLKNLKTARVRDEQSLYDTIYKMNWEDLFTIKNSFMINSSVNSPSFRHSLYVSQRVKDAIADRFRKITTLRPSVNTENPDITINVHISADRADISLDSSGEPLFKRGYRAAQYAAPLNEVLAAGMLLMTGWNGTGTLIDPMCGSGTLPIEAALIAKKIPPGVFRETFGFMKWKDYDDLLFKRVLESMLHPVEISARIMASDLLPDAVDLAKRSIKKALLDDVIELSRKDYRDIDPPEGGGIVIMNPPYGERLKEDEINNFYKQIGDTMKQKFPGYDVWILSGNPEALKSFGLHPGRKIDLYNGSIKCKFQKFSIYSGSKKQKMQKPLSEDKDI